MTIYGEYLFGENMIIGMVVLFFTEKFTGERIGRFRYILCGVLCGLYAFILFTSASGLLSLAGKILFSAVIVRLAFGRMTFSKNVEKAAIFFLFTVLYGGLSLAVLTSFGWTGVTAVSGIYLPAATYMTVMAVASCSAWMVCFFLRSITVKRMKERVMVEAEVKFGQKTRRLRGMIDSGNGLKEPLSGRAVCIVRTKLMEELLKTIESPQSRYTLIPYQAVGVSNGLLEGYRAEWISIDGHQLKNPVLAVWEGGSFSFEGDDFDILLPGIMLERGFHGDYSSVANLSGKEICMEKQTCILHRRK